MKRRYVLHCYSRHFPTIRFTPTRYWFRRQALAAARYYRATTGGILFRYELEDTRTGKTETM